MTAHELARVLLEMPDLPVIAGDDCVFREVVSIRSTEFECRNVARVLLGKIWPELELDEPE